MGHVMEMTPMEIQRVGWNVLKKQLGVVGALRFILQYEKGESDYTEMRRELFKDETVETLIDKMRHEGRI